MARVFFLVDGFNLYHALDWFAPGPDHNRYRKYKWMSLTRLARLYLTSKDTLAGVEYFTTLAMWDPLKVVRHRLFIKAQEDEGVAVVYGEFKRKTRKCPLCLKVYPGVEEKQTDVNIALRLFQLAVLERYDKAIIVSGDTDLLPAMKAVQTTFPAKQIGVVLPIGRASEDMKKQADFHYKMKEKHLQSSRYPDPLILRDGTALTCPANWNSAPRTAQAGNSP